MFVYKFEWEVEGVFWNMNYTSIAIQGFTLFYILLVKKEFRLNYSYVILKDRKAISHGY